MGNPWSDINNALAQARAKAEAVEDASARKAIEALANAVEMLAKLERAEGRAGSV